VKSITRARSSPCTTLPIAPVPLLPVYLFHLPVHLSPFHRAQQSAPEARHQEAAALLPVVPFRPPAPFQRSRLFHPRTDPPSRHCAQSAADFSGPSSNISAGSTRASRTCMCVCVLIAQKAPSPSHPPLPQITSIDPPRGPSYGGILVYISGTTLSDDLSCLFGDEVAPTGNLSLSLARSLFLFISLTSHSPQLTRNK
jgi:hypothetical protein